MSAAAPALPAVAAPERVRSSRVRRRLLWWSAVLAAFAVIAIVGPVAVPYDPITVRLGDRLLPPGAHVSDGSRAWLGTDQVGKDLVAQVLQGARISLVVGVSTVVVAGLFGLAVGVVGGYRGGAFDTIMMRLADLQLAFPSILLAILIAAVLGRSVANVIITLSVTRWVVFARVARASSLVTREREFVTAALATGAGTLRLIGRHIMPFALTPLIVIATVDLGLVMLAEASLSFLGLGTTPAHPSWGLIIATGRDYLTTAWWISTIPGLALSLVVLAVGQFGDAVRDALNPRSVTGT